MIRIAMLAMVATSLCAGPSLAQDSVPVRFEAGASSAEISGTIIGQESIDYVLRAREGQTMDVSLTVTGTNGDGIVYFNILPAGQDFPALFVGSRDGEQASVALPSSGDWAIRTYLMGNDRDTGKTVGYTIDVSIK